MLDTGIQLQNTSSFLEKLRQSDNGLGSLVSDLEYTYLDPAKAEASSFMKYDVGLLVSYLEECHREYRDLLLPNIFNSFDQLLKNAPNCKLLHKAGPIILFGFKEDLIAHFNYEESSLFPYARDLKQGKNRSDYSTSVFENNHPKFVVDIERLIKFFKWLSTDLETYMTYRILMKRLGDLKTEFEVHGLIEDRVLIPKLKSLE